MCNVVQLCLAASNILLMPKWNHAFLPLAIALARKWQNARYSLKNKLGNRMIKQLFNSVFAKYRDLSVSRRSIGHFRVSPGLCIKTRLSAQPLIWKWVFILTQIELIFTRKVMHLASFWKWGFLEVGSGLLSAEASASANNWSARHRQITIVCSTSLKNC